MSRWEFHSPRTELLPAAERERGAGLRISGNGDVHAFGWWHAPVEMSPGRWYRAEVTARITDIEYPELSVFANIASHYLGVERVDGDMIHLAQEFRHRPDLEWEGAPGFDLFLRATSSGSVEYSAPRVVNIPEPSHRTARVATTRFDSTVQGISQADQRERMRALLMEAGRVRPDLAVLTEMCPIVGVPTDQYGSYQDAAEPIPEGPTFQVVAECAKEANMNVVAGLIERRGKHVFNTAVIVDRTGRLCGRYDKTHLTFPELRGGVSCGNRYPVFDLDFGRIGIHICYDEWFPEVARLYAHLGAEVLLLPVWGGKPITWRTRALDNAMYFVSASVNPPSMVIGSSGDILAETHAAGVVYADVNLDHRETNAYRDPTLAFGMPHTVPQLRYCLDESLFDLLADRMRGTCTARGGNRRTRGGQT